MEDLEPIRDAEQSSFCVELLRRLHIQRGENYLCDITLVAKEGKELRAHRNVLSAVSPFFLKLLKSDMKEKEQGIIRFEEISESILADVLDFIYTGSIEVKDEETAKEQIMAAEYLLLVSLKTRSGRFLEKLLTNENCISTLRFAQKYRCEELVANSTKFVHDNFASVAESDEFLNLEAEEVEKWISSEKIHVAAEEDMFRVILKWVEQKNERKAKFEQLFRHIRLVSLSRDYLQVDVVTNDLVRESGPCLRQVLDAIKFVSSASDETLMQEAKRRLETHTIAVRGGKKTYCYLPEKNEWKRLADGVSDTRDQTTQMIKFRDNLYSFPRSTCNGIERYDPVFNSWATVTFSPPFAEHSLAVVNGQIHAIHRRYRSNPVITRYDVDLCVWQTVSSSQDFHYRDDSCVVACGNCLYVLGGGYSDKAGRFDVVGKKWEEIASMSTSLNRPFGVATQERIFVTNGLDCSVYEISTNEWQAIEGLNSQHLYGSMVYLNGILYVLGGLNNQSYERTTELTVEEYDPKVNKWILKSSIPAEQNSEKQKPSFKGCTLKLTRGLLNKLN